MTNYYSLISRSKDKVKEEELQDYVAEASLQVQKDVLDAQRAVKAAQNALASARSAYPFSTTAVVDAALELKAAEEVAQVVEATFEELFVEIKKAKKESEK